MPRGTAADWHLQTTFAHVIIAIRGVVQFLEVHARRERLHEDGSFFGHSHSRCALTSKLACAMWNAMQVQTFNPDLSRPEYERFITLCRELNLVYPFTIYPGYRLPGAGN